MRVSRIFESLILAAILVFGPACIAMAQQPNTTPSTPPVNGAEMDNFTQFLLNHPGQLKQLQQNPALLNDPNFLAQHPQLQTFLNNHPGVAQQVKSNPAAFVNDTSRFIAHGREITPAQAGATDNFLVNHPKIAHELQQTPGLIDDKGYLAQHPQLQQFLDNHPDIRKEWTEHPVDFEHHNAQAEKRINADDLSQGQATGTDQFLANHPQIAQQLSKNPGLIDNKEYLAQHQQLQQFLNNHPEIQDMWKQHPERFQQHLEQYQKNHPPNSQQTKAQPAKTQAPKN